MKPKKICEKDGCTRLSFGKFCTLHTAKKPLKKTVNSLKPKKTPEQRKKERKEAEKMRQFFLEIWNERPHYCEVTNVWLGREVLSTMMHHVLPKNDQAFPQYKYCKWNIALIHPDVHAQVENDMDSVPELKRRYLELLDKHLNNNL
jgi:hypothetical protein